MNEKDIQSKLKDNLHDLYLKQDFNNLLIESKKFIQKYNNNFFGWNFLALAYKGLENYSDAIKLYEGLLKNNPKQPIILANLGNLYSILGKTDESISFYERALKEDPNFVNACDAIGLAYINKGELDKALKYQLQAYNLDKKNPRIIYNLANTYRKKNMYKDAIKYFEKIDFALSKSHLLECVYLTSDKTDFNKYCSKIISEKKISPLISSIISHANIRYNYKFENYFCENSFDYIEHRNIISDSKFDQNLIDDLIGFHKSNNKNYKSQALLKNGQQSTGNIFDIDIPFIKKTENLIMNEIEIYKNNNKDSNCGFIKEWPERYKLHGWFISMQKEGHLNAHIHKEGWLSGSIYLKMPLIRKQNEGDIIFGLHGADYPDDNFEYPEKIVQLTKGDICLFPSSIFHRTLPFESDDERITLAFDIKPMSDGDY